MASVPETSNHRWKSIISGYPFWIITALIALTALLHLFSPQMRALPRPLNVLFYRHTIERIAFLVPVVAAAYTYGRRAGWVTLGLVGFIMLARALWISWYPADALLETLATVLIGMLLIWIVERRQTVARLRALNEVTAIVAGSLELKQVFNDALDKTLEVTHIEAGLIFSLDEKAGELMLVAYRGLSDDAVSELQRLRVGEGFCGRVAESGQLMVISDSSYDPRLTRLAVRREGLRAQVVVPLKSKDRVQGVMAVATRRWRQFFAEDLEFIAAIANQIGVAIENARLHEDVARQLRVQQRLNEVAEQITSEIELDRILPKVLQIAEELTGAQGGGIALFDQSDAFFRYPYLHNLPQELADVPISRGKGVAGEVMITGNPVVIENYQNYPSAIPEFAREGLTSVVAVPIVSGDQSFGTLTLVTLDRAKHFSSSDVTLLTGIARQTAIAIENARLYENLRFYVQQITRTQENERKRIARELHDETIQMLIVLSRRLEVLATLPGGLPEAAAPYLASLQGLIGATLKEMRRFIHDLRPPTLDHLGLVAALAGLADDLMENDRIETQLQVQGQVRRLEPQEIELNLFRVAQEALSNVRRHSRALKTRIEVSFLPDKVRMVIEDNGIGFNAPERIGDLVASGKLGLIGMAERTRTFGGTLDIHSRPGEGTTVVVDIPLHLGLHNREGDDRSI